MQPVISEPKPDVKQPSQPGSGKDFAAEGLRGLAALNVYFAHFFLAFFPLGFTQLLPGLQTSPAFDGRMEKILRLPFASILWNGNFAVCVFFVLSGFVLSKPYYAASREKAMDALRDRYLKRYLRLSIPIAASVLIGFTLMKLHWFHNLAAASLSHSDWYKQYFAFTPTAWSAFQEAAYRSIFFGEFNYNPPLWTMRVEFIGSLITFAFYTLMPAGGWRKTWHYVTAIACIAIFLQQDAIYYFAFLLGGAIWALPKPRAAVSYLFLAAGLFLGAFQLGQPFSWLPNLRIDDTQIYDPKNFYNVLGAFLLLWSMRCGFLDWLLASPPLSHLGRLSFSLYLTHFFVLSTFSCWFFVKYAGRWPRDETAAADWVFTTILVLLAAFVFERFVDRKGIEWSKRFVSRF